MKFKIANPLPGKHSATALRAIGLIWLLLIGSPSAGATTQDERQLYRQAITYLRSGETRAFQQTQKQLENYLLSPYLQYRWLNSQLDNISTNTLIAFVEQHDDLPVADILRARWLKRVGKQRRWQTYLSHFPPAWVGRDAALFCYYLRALYGTGQGELALQQTATAWTQPESQPKACDPLFDVWMASPHFTETVVWQRLQLALAENEVTLAKYLLRYFDAEARPAEDFYAVHVRPQRLADTRRYLQDSAKYRQIVMHGITRLARSDPQQAARVWRKYHNRMDYNAVEIGHIEDAIAIALADAGTFPKPSARDQHSNVNTLSALATAAVEQQQWDEVIYWTERMPPAVRQQARWQYWLARALMASTGDTERARLAYQSLAHMRQYYGFWAAYHLGLNGKLNATPRPAGRALYATVLAQPNIARSLELFAVEDDLNARREWFAALRVMTPKQQALAAEVARENGLISLAISTANTADSHDAVHLRFPVAYEPQFRRASLVSGLPPALLFAVARQESAMNAEARSHANARGLMQLMPATAKLVARRHFLASPKVSDLYDPGTNIVLGSSHLAWLLQRYNGQVAPAIAAYNAGEHRADRWLKQAHGMPLDVWIENIPFRETRNYVKNVLAFRFVYGQLLDSALPFVQHAQLTINSPD